MNLKFKYIGRSAAARDSVGCVRWINAIEVVRLDPNPLDVRATGSKRVEVNPFHLSADLFAAFRPRPNELRARRPRSQVKCASTET